MPSFGFVEPLVLLSATGEDEGFVAYRASRSSSGAVLRGSGIQTAVDPRKAPETLNEAGMAVLPVWTLPETTGTRITPADVVR